MQEQSNENLPFPKSEDVARRIYRNANENRVLRSIHRLLVKLEHGESLPQRVQRIVDDASQCQLKVVRASDMLSAPQDEQGAEHE